MLAIADVLKEGEFNVKKRVLGTLDFGMLLPHAIEIIGYFSLTGLVIILVLDIVAAILQFGAVYIGLIPVLLICLAFFIWIVSCQVRHKKFIAKWVEDAVEVEASLIEVVPFSITPYRIRNDVAFQIKFTYNGKSIVLNTDTIYKQSSAKGMLKMYKPLRSFISEKLCVLYSPTFNKVMFYK